MERNLALWFVLAEAVKLSGRWAFSCWVPGWLEWLLHALDLAWGGQDRGDLGPSSAGVASPVPFFPDPAPFIWAVVPN